MDEARKKRLLLLALKYLPAWTPVMFALIYCLGYSIVAIYLRSNGLAGLNLFEPQYFEVGATFCFITFTLTIVPVLLVCLHKNFSYVACGRARCFLARICFHNLFSAGRPSEEQDVPKAKWMNCIWIISIRLLALFLTMVCFIVFLFLALFATGYEWNKAVGAKGGLGFAGPFKIYLPAMLIVFWLLPMLRKTNFKHKESGNFLGVDPSINNLNDDVKIRTLYTLVIICGVIITFNFIKPVLQEVDWLGIFCTRAWDYLFFILMLFAGVFVLRSISATISKEKMYIRHLLWLAGTPFLIFCAYSGLTMYAYRIYHILPVRSGGMCPSAVMQIEYKGEDKKTIECYLIAETPDLLVTVPVTNSNWFTESLPLKIFDRKDIKQVTFQQRYDGRPRNNGNKAN